MNSRLTLRHLEAFRAVMERHSVTGAAELLGVTQPVVTRLIADFEERVAFPLFTRQKGRLVPTAEAELLIGDVQQAMMLIERISYASSNIRELRLGKLLVAAAPAVALCCLPQAIAAFTQENPETLISLRMEASPAVLDLVHEGRADLGVAMLPATATTIGNREPLLSARMVAVVPKDHRLAAADILRPVDFDGEAFVTMSPLIEARTLIDAVFTAHNVRRRVNIETQISLAVIRHVEAGAGVGLVDPVTAAGYPSDWVRFIPFEPPIANDYTLVTSVKRKPPLVMEPFVEHLRRHIRAMVPAAWRMS